MPLPKAIISDQNELSPLKFMASLGKTMDRINETATRASLSGIPIDPRSYQSQLLQTLQGGQGTRVEYFTIRNKDENDEAATRNDEPHEGQDRERGPAERLAHGRRGGEPNEMRGRSSDQIVDNEKKRINKGGENRERKMKDHSRLRDAVQDGAEAAAGHGERSLQEKGGVAGSSSQDCLSVEFVDVLKKFDARLRQRRDVEKLCRRVQFIPIVLMWCPSLLAG